MVSAGVLAVTGSIYLRIVCYSDGDNCEIVRLVAGYPSRQFPGEPCLYSGLWILLY